MVFDTTTSGMRDALLLLGAAGLVIPAFARFRITPVIGFIMIGALIGPHGLAALAGMPPALHWLTISDEAALAPFAEFGIILLLFSIGLELSFKKLWAMRRLLIGFGATELLGGAVLVALALMLTGSKLAPALGLGLALSLSSTALVLPMTKAGSSVGKLALAMLLFEDLALVPIIFFLGVLVSGGDRQGMTNLVSVASFGFATVAAMLLAGPFVLPRLFAQAARTKSPELFLAAILLIVILASLATSSVGLSPIVGALVAGLLIAETRYVGEVEALILPFKGLALGVFLITVGMSLDFAMIAERWHELALASLAVIAIKSVVTSSLLRLGGVRKGIATETGLLLASPSETTLIVLSSAAAAGLIGAQTASFWTVVTAIGLTVTPLLATTGRFIARRLDRSDGEKAERSVPQLEVAHTLLIGFGRVGRMVATMLDEHSRAYIAIEADLDAVSAAKRRGQPVLYGDASRMAFLDRLDMRNVAVVVLTMDDPVQAVRITERLRSRHADLTIVARARDTDHAAELYRAGATDAVPETLESSLQLSEAVLVDLGVAMGPVIASIHEKRDELRAAIKDAGLLETMPRLGRLSPSKQP